MSEFLDEIEECVPPLRRYARSLTRNADHADDLVQDCLERAIRKQALWRPSGPLRAWLFRMLLNIYRNDLRHRRRRPATISIDLVTELPHVAAPQPGRMALAETARALELLPEEQRAALLLVVLEGLSYAEAAEALAIPQGTLMSRIGRARVALRQMTDGRGETRLRTVK
ncbi:MAG: sigma-70 family RNA polymerase sigma factor [Cucumibacter sp.]